MMLQKRLLVFGATVLLTGAMMAAGASSTGERPRLLAVGNPLLDIVATVDSDFLEKYKLTPGDGVLQTEAQEGIYEELVQDFSPQYLPGGSELNTARTLKALWKQDGDVAYLGAVGTDEAGKVLEELALGEGLEVFFQKVPDMPTGRCAVLVSGHDRTLCTHLGAASEISVSSKEEDMIPYFDGCYITSYVLHSTPEPQDSGKRTCSENPNSCPLTAVSQKDAIRELLPSINVLFGNSDEYSVFAKEHGLLSPKDSKLSGDELDKRACLAIFDLMNVKGKETSAPAAGHAASFERSRGAKVAVMTRAHHPVMVAESSPANGAIVFYTVPVLPVPQHEIVDTNGAGDAFAGAFLSAFMRGQSARESVILGSRVAARVVRCVGFCVGTSGTEDVVNSKQDVQVAT